MMFALPPAHEYWRQKPLSYLSHLLGHEGDGSVLALLKSLGWATSLSAGAMHFSKDFEMFLVTVDLTKEGFGRCFLV